jgi:membrane associated rhomboid family serine protease
VGSRFPRTATNIIVALTALAWMVAVVLGRNEMAALSLGFIPLRVSVPPLPLPFPAVPAFLTPLTATLVHSSLLHLGFNMLILLWCGSQVERVLGATGLIVLYVVGAYAAAAAQWAIDPMATVPVVGASGAISAVIGAFALSFGRAKAITNNLWLNRWINVLWLMVAWVLLQMATTWLAGTQGVLVATAAHVGGFAAGLLLQRPLLLWRYRKA